ncbi:MAG: hypothetical protein BGO01_08820 [Armatimonadetes bacterium 55-13]|nr:MAG: hypothetical protein BGO01_08820 [Armatimonadetes bacterium 55-13]
MYRAIATIDRGLVEEIATEEWRLKRQFTDSKKIFWNNLSWTKSAPIIGLGCVVTDPISKGSWRVGSREEDEKLDIAVGGLDGTPQIPC